MRKDILLRENKKIYILKVEVMAMLLGENQFYPVDGSTCEFRLCDWEWGIYVSVTATASLLGYPSLICNCKFLSFCILLFPNY